MLCYRVGVQNSPLYFPIDFKFKENAEILRNYLSKRDGRTDYYIKLSTILKLLADSIIMEGQTRLSWVALKERFESTALHYYKYFIK